MRGLMHEGDAEDSTSARTADPPRPSRVRHAAGIYGLIVTGAVLASAGGHLRTVPLTVAVFGTLVVYWLAEEYAQLGEHVSSGHLPSWPQIRAGLSGKWPMVSASYVPLLALVGARLLGSSPAGAAYIALGVSVAVLIFYGWSGGRASGVHGIALGLMTGAAGALGVLMIVLKFSIAHLH